MHSNSNLRNPLLVVLLVACYLLSIQQRINGQNIETDEQFEAYHHDISRINPAAPSGQVAPASIVKQIVPLQQPQAPQVVPTRQQTRSRLRSTGGLSRLTTVGEASQDSIASTRVALASVAAPVSVVVAPLQQPKFTSAATNQDQALYDQPALASFKASNSYNGASSSDQQQRVATFQPSFLALPPPGSPTSQQQQAVSNSVTSLRSYPSESSAQVAPAPASAPQQPVHSQLEPVVAFSSQQLQSSSSSLASTLDQVVAPSYEHVLSHGCPNLGVFSYPHADHCDRYYMCTNGTFTEEACPNGLSYGTQGAVYQHCAYRWNIDCGTKKAPGPIASPGCPWQFGVFPVSGQSTCSINYHECEWGVPEVKTCHPEGLFYDERIKGCQWADQLGCNSEALLNFKCPHEDEDNQYWPFPRYYHSQTDVIVCVNEQPRLVHCTEDQLVDPNSLSCIDIKKKKKKF